MAFDSVTTKALPSTEVTCLHVFRHGKVETGGKRLALGHSDLPISQVGKAQHRAIVELALASISEAAGVISSDLGRCSGLAGEIGEALGLPVLSYPELREQNMGAWELSDWADLTAADEDRVQAYWNDYVHTRPPGGENFDDVVLRVRAWWATHRPALRDQTWIVITHVGVIRALGCAMLGVPVDQALRMAPARGSYSRFLVSDTGGVVETLGMPVLREEAPRPARSGPPKIALSGSAGTGKTTLGTRLAAHYSVPFLEEGMRTRLENGLNLHDLSMSQLADLVEGLWNEQQENENAALRECGGFVSDRSSVDFAAFWLHYGFAQDQPRAAAFVRETLAHSVHYDRIVVLPWAALPLVADGYRSTNTWIQKRYQALLEGLLFRDVPEARRLILPDEIIDLDARFQWVVKELSRD